MPLSDIVACSPERLSEVITTEEAYSEGAWFLAKNIDMIVLSMLGEFLRLGSYDDLMKEFKLVGEPLDEGPWPQTIPPKLIAKLREISDAEIDDVVPQWGAIEEFHGGDPQGLREYLVGLRNFLAKHPGPYFLVLGL